MSAVTRLLRNAWRPGIASNQLFIEFEHVIAQEAQIVAFHFGSRLLAKPVEPGFASLPHRLAQTVIVQRVADKTVHTRLDKLFTAALL